MMLLPYMDEENKLIDGTYFHLLPFCKKNCASGKCKDHYEKMQNADAGSYCCPYGLVSYVYASPNKNIIFTGLKIRGIYNKKKAKTTEPKEFVYNQIIDEAACHTLAKEISISLLEKHELKSKLNAINDLLHETRSLNGQIKNSIDLLWETDSEETPVEYDTMLETLKNVHVSSFMISNRFSYFDSVLNPSLSFNNPYTAVIFKKFDKMRRLLKDYQRKNVWIRVDSPKQSDYRYSIYPTFETLLFILLENAIKYSPENKPIEVSFDEKEHILDVTIKSIGPYCDENEILRLCDKGFRSKNAKIVQSNGQGFGLNFAKQICLAHNIGISFESVYLNKEQGVKYGTFYVRLHFDNSLERND